jgi:hypothetical protein
MRNLARVVVVCGLLAFAVYAQEAVSNAIHGTITKLDEAGKTVVVKTKDGVEYAIHFTEKTTVWGADKTAVGAKESFRGLSEGSEVVAHYTVKGTENTAVEVDKVGKGGLKSVDGTVTKVGADGKTVVVKAADGTEHTFSVVGHDTAESAKAVGRAADKTGKTTVYYTEQGGKKVAHFFEKL